MARKDLERETERPRYYSQFWLDVAAGRRVIAAGKGAEEGESGEAEAAPEMTSKGGKVMKGAEPQPVVEAEPIIRRPTTPAAHPPLRLSDAESLADLAAAAGLLGMEPDAGAAQLEEGDAIEDLEPLPATDVAVEAEPKEEVYTYTEVYADEEEGEEEEEEEGGGGWPSSRRGKKQQHKKSDKPRRRERGRDF